MSVTTKSFAVIIPVKDSRVFLMRRKAKHNIGKWEFPAGKGEVGEVPLNIAIREYREETGVIVTSDDLCEIMCSHTPGMDHANEVWFNVYYVAECGHEKMPRLMEPDTHDKVGWFTMDELRNMYMQDTLVPTTSPVVEVVRQVLA